ncbi:hypothetical protein Hanom_Chr09g00852021 [Helianthus anomalus]
MGLSRGFMSRGSCLGWTLPNTSFTSRPRVKSSLELLYKGIFEVVERDPDIFSCSSCVTLLLY